MCHNSITLENPLTWDPENKRSNSLTFMDDLHKVVQDFDQQVVVVILHALQKGGRLSIASMVET